MRESNAALLERPIQAPIDGPRLAAAGAVLVAGVENFLRQQTKPAQPVKQPWVNAGDIAFIYEAQLLARTEAERKLEERHHLLCEGKADQVPLPVDALSTAARVIAAEDTYGRSSHRYREAREYLDMDCNRLMGEANSKLALEFFEETEQPYDEEAKAFFYKGYNLTSMVDNGLSPMAEPEEQGYRVGEAVEEATYTAARSLGSLALRSTVATKLKIAPRPNMPHVRMNTISQCADWAIALYNKKSKAGTGGYVPEKRKVMIRGIRFDPVSGSRFEEGISVPGMYFTPEIVSQVLADRKVIQPGKVLTKAEARATHAINLNDEGVLTVLADLDELASRATGKSIFKGEIVPDNHPKDYASIPAEAKARQEQLRQASGALADFLIMLERHHADRLSAVGIVEQEVKRLLFEHVKHDPKRAAIAFNDETADALKRVASLRSVRNYEAARLLERLAFDKAPAAEFCGSNGGCGIQAVNSESVLGKAIKKLLNAKAGKRLARNSKTRCRECGKVSLVYAYDGEAYSTGCISCEAAEINE